MECDRDILPSRTLVYLLYSVLFYLATYILWGCGRERYKRFWDDFFRKLHHLSGLSATEPSETVVASLPYVVYSFLLVKSDSLLVNDR